MATYQSQQQSNGATVHSQTSQKVVESSTTSGHKMPMREEPRDEIDSALNDLMIVSQMATTNAPAEHNKGKKSVRMAESHQSTHVSSGPVVVQTASGATATGSFSSRQQFYSYSSSSSSSKQQVVSSSSGTMELPAQTVAEKSVKSSGGASSSSSSQHSKSVTSSSGNKHLDYSRINQNASAMDSLTQQQLDSPVCNFTVRL